MLILINTLVVTATLKKENLDKTRKKLGFLNDKDDFEIL